VQAATTMLPVARPFRPETPLSTPKILAEKIPKKSLHTGFGGI
jgi:hypothetical protein